MTVQSQDVDASAAPLSAVLDLLDGLEQKLSLVKALQAEQEQQFQELTLRAQQLADADQKLREQQRRALIRRARLKGLRQTVIGRRRQLDQTAMALRAAAKELGNHTNAFAEQRKQLELDISEIQAQRDELSRQRTALEQASESLHARESAIEQAAALASTQNVVTPALTPDVVPVATQAPAPVTPSVPVNTQELDELRTQLAQITQQLAVSEARSQELSARATELTAQRDALQSKLDELAVSGEKVQQETLSNDAALTEAREQVQRIEEKLSESQKKLEEAQTRLAELEQLTQGFADEKSQLLAEARAAQDELTARLAAVERVNKELQEQADSLKTDKERIKGQLAELRSRSTMPGIAAGPDMTPEQAAALRVQLDEQQRSVESREAELEQKLAVYRDSVKRAREQLMTEQKELDEQADAVKQQGLRFNAKFEDLRLAYSTFKERRKRLHRYRQILRVQVRSTREAQDKIVALHQQYTGLLQQRQTLREVKQFLASSEEHMARKWATHSSVALSCFMVVAVLLMAIFSHAAGQNAIEPVWRVTETIEIEPEAKPDAKVSASAWAAEERKLLLSEPVLREALSQMAQRGVRGYSEPEPFEEHLKAALTIDAPMAGKLSLAYKNTDKALALGVLESLGRARVSYQMVQDRQAGRPNSAKIVQAATLDAAPIEDGRWQLSLKIFGALLGTTMVLSVLLRLWMNRAQRLFDAHQNQGISDVDDEQKWPDLSESVRSTRI
jgi:chromosome segregation ATPase